MVIALILIDLLIVIGISMLVGAVAPRIPQAWLEQTSPRAIRWESDAMYRRIGAPFLARRLPELGATFGGQSKAALPGSGRQQLAIYLVEVRRAEIVHLCSALSWVPLTFFNPWWLTAAFAMIVVAGNALFLIVLRYNRVRLVRLLNRLPVDPPEAATGEPR